MIRANRFLASLNELKRYVEERAAANCESRDALDRVMASFRRTYDRDGFKQALAEDLPIPDDLEESITSATTILRRERATSSAAVAGAIDGPD